MVFGRADDRNSLLDAVGRRMSCVELIPAAIEVRVSVAPAGCLYGARAGRLHLEHEIEGDARSRGRLVDPGRAEADCLRGLATDRVPGCDAAAQPPLARHGPGMCDHGCGEVVAESATRQLGCKPQRHVEQRRVGSQLRRPCRFTQTAESDQLVVGVPHGPIALVGSRRLERVLYRPRAWRAPHGDVQPVIDGQIRHPVGRARGLSLRNPRDGHLTILAPSTRPGRP